MGVGVVGFKLVSLVLLDFIVTQVGLASETE